MAVKKIFWLLAVVTAASPQNGLARDPVSYLHELLDKADAVVLGKVTKTTKSNKYSDLNPEDFEEYVIELEVRCVFKGDIKRGSKLLIITYKSTGRGAPGNFGSTMNLFGSEKRSFHLLYLTKRDDTWMPASGYGDGGNSHFLAMPSGHVE